MYLGTVPFGGCGETYGSVLRPHSDEIQGAVVSEHCSAFLMD